MTLLTVSNLKVYFPVGQGMLHRNQAVLKAVDDVSFTIEPGETLGLVGESGCGKTTLGRVIVRLIEPTSGAVSFEGNDISMLNGKALRKLRRGFQMIFQDPYGSLDPRMTVEESVGEALEINHLSANDKARQLRVGELLCAVGLEAEHAERYPHQLSGGQRQRVGIARSLAVRPKLIVCDEPVSALDISVQAQIINLLQDLQTSDGIAYLFITHDLAVVEHISRRVMVMYLGKIVELADAKTIVRSPRHPYTQALVSAIPVLDSETGKRIVLGGDLPSPLAIPSGCPFHPRCPRAEFPRCNNEMPVFREIAPGHWASCHFA